MSAEADPARIITPEGPRTTTAINEHPLGYPDGVRTILVIQEGHVIQPEVPVFDARISSHHEIIARHYSDYDKMGT